MRLKNYDYSKPGYYFITINTKNREKLFGRIYEGYMYLNEFGKIVLEEWYKSEEIRDEFILDEFVIMPDHIHGIIIIRNMNLANTPFYTYQDKAYVNKTLKPKSISSFVAGFKGATSKRINAIHGTIGKSNWQKGYYDKIIKNSKAYYSYKKYIYLNPQKKKQI